MYIWDIYYLNVSIYLGYLLFECVNVTRIINSSFQLSSSIRNYTCYLHRVYYTNTAFPMNHAEAVLTKHHSPVSPLPLSRLVAADQFASFTFNQGP